MKPKKLHSNNDCIWTNDQERYEPNKETSNERVDANRMMKVETVDEEEMEKMFIIEEELLIKASDKKV